MAQIIIEGNEKEIKIFLKHNREFIKRYNLKISDNKSEKEVINDKSEKKKYYKKS